MESNPAEEARLPLARKDDLLVERLSDETLVYDLRNHKAHCLNAGAALVWQHCDGEFDKARMTSLLHEKLGAPEDPALVEIALQELAAAKLLRTDASKEKLSRREAARALKNTVGAAIALPTVLSIVAPTAASAATLVLDCGAIPLAFCGGQECAHSQGTSTHRCKIVSQGQAQLCKCVA